MSSRRRLPYVAWGALIACSQATSVAPPLNHAQLPSGVVARVGADEISLETVQRVARAQGVALSVARERSLSDALFAAGARAAFRDRNVASVLERAAWARALLERLKQDALAQGPATDAEVAELTALRWRELDRPETARTTHAVVIVDKPADDARARELAQRTCIALANEAALRVRAAVGTK